MRIGATCFGMLKPKRLANHSIAYRKVGESKSSVWCRNGRAVMTVSKAVVREQSAWEKAVPPFRG